MAGPGRMSVERNVDEIISYMQNKFRPYEIFEHQMKKITHELMELGYTLDEITRGINAYLLQLEPESSDQRRKEKSPARELTFRVLERGESRYIGRDAYGYLCLLRGLGLVSRDETEELIGYIVENEIEVEDGEGLQSVMLDLMSAGGGEEELDDDDQQRGHGRHGFRNRRLN